MTGNVSTRHILQLFIFLSILLGLVATSTAWAGDDIGIDRANWSSDLNRLTVRGEDAPDNSTVTLRYGEKDDNGAVIDTTEADQIDLADHPQRHAVLGAERPHPGRALDAGAGLGRAAGSRLEGREPR